MKKQKTSLQDTSLQDTSNWTVIVSPTPGCGKPWCRTFPNKDQALCFIYGEITHASIYDGLYSQFTTVGDDPITYTLQENQENTQDFCHSFLKAFTEKVIEYTKGKEYDLIRQWGISDDETKSWVEKRFTNVDDLYNYVLDSLSEDMVDWNSNQFVIKNEDANANARPVQLTETELEEYYDICGCVACRTIMIDVEGNIVTQGNSHSATWVWTKEEALQHLRKEGHYYWGGDHKYFIEL